MSSVTNRNFFQEVAFFASNHKVLCTSILGLAVVGYIVAGRIISWIYKSVGTTKKTSDVGLDTISALSSKSPSAELPQATKNLLTAYKSPQEGWVMVPPKEQMQLDKPFVIGSGAMGFSGNGRWKMHLSIDPNQMEQAIPIVMEVLHSPSAPRLGFKMQTKSNLDSVHQIGKEFAIIFDQKEEAAAIQGNRHAIEDCLSTLWKRLYNAKIRPEAGVVLTPQTMEVVRAAPSGNQIKEKQNLEIGKFDRAIPCPKNCTFFHYRDENFVPMRDDEMGDLKGTPGVYAASDVLKLACEQPGIAHNPTQAPDPFLDLHIQE